MRKSTIGIKAQGFQWLLRSDSLEILHSSFDDVPLGAVGDTFREVGALGAALVHEGVVAGVDPGQVLEEDVVGCLWGHPCCLEAIAVVVWIVGLVRKLKVVNLLVSPANAIN